MASEPKPSVAVESMDTKTPVARHALSLNAADQEHRESFVQDLEKARRQLYDVGEVPECLRDVCSGGPLSFVDHAFGKMPPGAHFAAVRRMFEMQQRGNSMWDDVFSNIIPEASSRVLDILGLAEESRHGLEGQDAGGKEGNLGEGAAANGQGGGGEVGADAARAENGCTGRWTVEFGHNSHELTMRLMSSKFHTDGELRLLTSDGEFYSLTRQLNMLISGLRCKRDEGTTGAHEQGKWETDAEPGLASFTCGCVQISCIHIEPVDTFAQRFAQAATSPRAYNFLYCSHVQFSSQQSLFGDASTFAVNVREAVKQGWHAAGRGQEADCWDRQRIAAPFFVIDGYHSFGAIPVQLSLTTPAFYMAGVLKHMACGPNAAFMTIPPGLRLRPLVTGWLADPSVLVGRGVCIGDDVGFQDGLQLMGGTPAFANALVMFCEVTKRWHLSGLTVSYVHHHVITLQDSFVSHLPDYGYISRNTLLRPQGNDQRSHTLVFVQESETDAREAVVAFRAHGIELDCRRRMLRIGFGFNHSSEDVAVLVSAMSKVQMGYGIEKHLTHQPHQH